MIFFLLDWLMAYMTCFIAQKKFTFLFETLFCRLYNFFSESLWNYTYLQCFFTFLLVRSLNIPVFSRERSVCCHIYERISQHWPVFTVICKTTASFFCATVDIIYMQVHVHVSCCQHSIYIYQGFSAKLFYLLSISTEVWIVLPRALDMTVFVKVVSAFPLIV